MACACKSLEKLEDKESYRNADGSDIKRGAMFYLKYAFHNIFIGRILMSCFLLLLCIILFPIVAIILVVTQLLNGKAHMIAPENLIARLNKVTKEKDNNGEEL